MIFNSEWVQLIWNLLVLPCPHQASRFEKFLSLLLKEEKLFCSFTYTYAKKCLIYLFIFFDTTTEGRGEMEMFDFDHTNIYIGV